MPNCNIKITQVVLEPNQVIDNNQLNNIISYQQNPQQHILQTPDGRQISYIVQEDDQQDNYNLVQQSSPVYVQKFTTDGQPILQQGIIYQQLSSKWDRCRKSHRFCVLTIRH